jgi:hypothetical protein
MKKLVMVAAVAGLGIGMHGWNGFVRAEAQAVSTVTAAGVTLHSVSVTWPSSDRMFPGDVDAEAINNNCLACHSVAMVLNQPALSRTAWKAEVEKMRSQFKAPVDEKDVPAIVAYLASHHGPK